MIPCETADGLLDWHLRILCQSLLGCYSRALGQVDLFGYIYEAIIVAQPRLSRYLVGGPFGLREVSVRRWGRRWKAGRHNQEHYVSTHVLKYLPR